DRRGQIRPGVEEVVLHDRQHRGHPLVEVGARERHAEGGVGLLAVRVCHEAGVVLRHAGEVGQAGGAVVAGAGVDACEVNSHETKLRGARARRSRVRGGSCPRVYPVSANPTSREESFLVRGGTRLSGEISVSGAKNSVLKLMAVALMAEGRTTLTNCPTISDVPAMADVLRHLGCTVEVSGDTVVIDTPAELGHVADDKAAQRLRASVCILGPLVGRHHRAVIAMPGGDAIGSRPLNWHQNGLNRLGARTHMDHGRLVADATELRGANYELSFPSVGATETFVTAAVLAEGTSVLKNAAREPEIVDICDLLNEMGAQISGAGTSTITVEGVR